jgi:putative nucleotidyltransferase with HDIG domain
MPPTFGWGHSERVFWFLEDVTAKEGVPFPQLKFHIDDLTKELYPEIDFENLRDVDSNTKLEVSFEKVNLPAIEEMMSKLEENVDNEYHILHAKMVAAGMRAYAEKLGANPKLWYLSGLLHDIDVEITNADPETHGLKSREILEKYHLDQNIIDAISMHNEEATKQERNSFFEHALAAGETITGLIYATALVYPDRKIGSIKYKSVKKRMKEKAFAASVKRENILECEKIGIPLDDFIRISVDAMREISDDIGL